jgi:hypothetical protein
MPADAPSPARSPGRFDPLGPLAAAAATAVFVLHGFDGILTRDLALYAYAGQQVADGVPPYEGVMNRSGPLAHLVPGLGAFLARLVGIDDLLGMRLLFLVLSALCVWAMYALARDLYDGSRAAGLTGAALLVCVPAMTIYATGGPREKTTMMLLLELALLAAVHRRWWWAGVCVALTTLTWQPVLFPALAAVALAAALGPRGTRWRALGAIAAGGLVASALMTLYFVLVGAVDEFLDGFVRIHLSYTYQPGLYDDLERQWEGILLGFGTSVHFVIAGIVLLVLLAPAELALPGRRESDVSRTRVAFAIATVVGLAWSWRVFNGWADALMLLPFAALGLAALVSLVVAYVPWRVGLALATAWVVLAVALGQDWSRHEGEDEKQLPKQEQELAAAMAVLPDDATVLSIEAPQVLVLTGRTNPTQHQMFRLGLEEYVDDTWPGGLAGYAAYVREKAPTVVVVGPGARYDWLLEGIDDDYTQTGSSPGWWWFARNDLGQQTLDDLTAATRG